MKQISIRPALCSAVAAAALGVPAVFADGTTNELVKAESSVEMPTAEIEAFYSSRKIERGMVENPESVFGYEAEVEWYGCPSSSEEENCSHITKTTTRKEFKWK